MDLGRQIRFALVIGVLTTTGCASFTNPVANGIPVRLLPEELLAQSKESLVPVSLHRLQKKQDAEYTIGPGDILSVYVETVLGEKGSLPPINMPDATANLAPSVGFPIPVLEDGTMPLPLIEPLAVDGLTLVELRREIRSAYAAESIIREDEHAVLATLVRPRGINVIVIREDGGELNSSVGRQGFSGNSISAGRSSGKGSVVELPANQNDVLTALTLTGGLPSSDAANEIVIERSNASESPGPEVRIPLSLPPGQRFDFDDEDVALNEGDILYVRARSRLSQAFYTGGLLPAVKVSLPRDEDLNVLQAIALVGGPLVNGGTGRNNLSGNIIGGGVGAPSPSLLTVLRTTPDGRQVPIRVDLNAALRDPRERILVKEGDFLILQETTGEAFARYLSGIFRFNGNGTIYERADFGSSGSFSLP